MPKFFRFMFSKQQFRFIIVTVYYCIELHLSFNKDINSRIIIHKKTTAKTCEERSNFISLILLTCKTSSGGINSYVYPSLSYHFANFLFFGMGISRLATLYSGPMYHKQKGTKNACVIEKVLNFLLLL